MQKAVVVVKAKQQRADQRFTLIVPEAADHAVRAAVVLDLLHSSGSPERYSRSERLAMMPSSVAPTSLSQAFASLSLVVAGDNRIRVLSLKYRRAKASSLRRRSRSGRCVSD